MTAAANGLHDRLSWVAEAATEIALGQADHDGRALTPTEADTIAFLHAHDELLIRLHDAPTTPERAAFDEERIFMETQNPELHTAALALRREAFRREMLQKSEG